MNNDLWRGKLLTLGYDRLEYSTPEKAEEKAILFRQRGYDAFADGRTLIVSDRKIHPPEVKP